MKWRRYLLVGALAVVLTLVLLPRSGNAETRQQLVARGKYLVIHVAHCISCHSPLKRGKRVAGLELSGTPGANAKMRKGPPQNVGFPGPFGARNYPSNLTSDKQTGLGAWSEADFIRAIKERVNPQGKRYAHTQMEWDVYRNIKVADLKAIFAYFQSVPPVKNKVPANIPPKFPPGMKRGK